MPASMRERPAEATARSARCSGSSPSAFAWKVATTGHAREAQGVAARARDDGLVHVHEVEAARVEEVAGARAAGLEEPDARDRAVRRHRHDARERRRSRPAPRRSPGPRTRAWCPARAERARELLRVAGSRRRRARGRTGVTMQTRTGWASRAAAGAQGAPRRPPRRASGATCEGGRTDAASRPRSASPRRRPRRSGGAARAGSSAAGRGRAPASGRGGRPGS